MWEPGRKGTPAGTKQGPMSECGAPPNLVPRRERSVDCRRLWRPHSELVWGSVYVAERAEGKLLMAHFCSFSRCPSDTPLRPLEAGLGWAEILKASTRDLGRQPGGGQVTFR